MKKKAPVNPVIVTKPMTDLEEFQAQYGQEWRKLSDLPVFQAGLQLLRERKLAYISNLPLEDIEKNSREYISDLRGHLQLENDLVNLHDKREFKFPLEEPDEYISPEQAAELEKQMAVFREQTRKARYGS